MWHIVSCVFADNVIDILWSCRRPPGLSKIYDSVILKAQPLYHIQCFFGYLTIIPNFCDIITHRPNSPTSIRLNHAFIQRFRRYHAAICLLQIVGKWNNVVHITFCTVCQYTIFNDQCLISIIIEHQVSTYQIMTTCVYTLCLPKPPIKFLGSPVIANCPLSIQMRRAQTRQLITVFILGTINLAIFKQSLWILLALEQPFAESI